MKEMRFKRFVTIILAVSMVLGSTVVAMADTTTLSGNGTYEGHLDKKVFSVTLPTAASDAFDFKFDPEGLISATAGARYGQTFDSGKTVYFYNQTNANNKKWTDTSTTVSAQSASSVSVDLTATVTVTSANGISFVSQNTAAVLSGNTTPNLYLALVDSDDTGSPAAVQTSGSALRAVYTKTVDAVAADKFEVSYNSGAYKYQPIGGTLADENKKVVRLYMTGAANTEADWSAITAQPKIEVVWAMTEHSDDPYGVIASGATPILSPAADGATYQTTLVNGVATNIVFNLASGVTVRKVYANGNYASLTTENADIVTYTGNTVTLKGNSSWATAASGTVKYIKVVPSSGDATIVKIVCN